MESREEFEILFELACADLKLVEKNLEDRDIRPQILLFHLQQAVEKFLKSLLSYKNIQFPKVHDIGELIYLCEENRIILPEFSEEFIKLTPYAVEFRYGLMVEEVQNIKYYCFKVQEFKKFVEDTISK